MTISETEKLVIDLTDRHRDLDQRRLHLISARHFLEMDVAADNTEASKSNASAYAATVTELEAVGAELAAASRELHELKESERREAAKQAEARRAKDLARRDDLIDEGLDLAEQLDTLLDDAADVARKLDSLMAEAARLGGGDGHMWARRATQSALRMLSSAPWRLERPNHGTPDFSELVALIGGRRRSAA